ncbi:hypothetical protein BCV69DRAFT_299048 [Microstroma glucosiphilum]|uniref:Uncharacterized protein n=1 Tax=Pseudomicrostroma glucosiphilum TaxID=1684307 RepID=A0A316U5Q1_9BASI|nr:hypothetical protein BCV69DRAFT_299048 [Pseudomicrostroma glucosiphilum]PWN20566.1 hypothetical protein BCV69DRAFT_299048 [Pseudomicrostroma glucosiphilum]
MTFMDGDEMHRLWALVADLTSQLNLNRQHLADVQSQVEVLKGRAVHNQTGFALRRFNVDVSKEKFESELERLNAHLAQENNELKWENKMNDRLIKEFEQCLEIVMKKFRIFSHATQSHTLKLTQHYEELLASNTYNAASASLHASTALSSTLAHLSTLVRSALREVEGEGEGATLDDDETGSIYEASSSRQTLGYGSTSDPRWYGSGGYTGKLGDPDAQRSDAALERATELQRLRVENEELRRVLDLAEGKGLDVGFGKEKLSLGAPRRGRKASVSQAISTAIETTQQQPPLPAPRASTSRIPSIPAAPLPTASIGSPSAASRQITTPPPPVPKPHRTPLREKLQQAAEAIHSTSSPPSANNVVPPVGLPAIPDILLGTPEQSTRGPGSTLIPTPPDSAPAQSDIRSAPLLPLASPKGDGTQPPVGLAGADAEEVSPLAAAMAAEAGNGEAIEAEEAIDLGEEPNVPKPLAGQTEGGEDVPKDSLELLLDAKDGGEEAVVDDLQEVELPANQEIDLSDGEPAGGAVTAVESSPVEQAPLTEQAVEPESKDVVGVEEVPVPSSTAEEIGAGSTVEASTSEPDTPEEETPSS